MDLSLAIDIGGTKFAVGLVNRSGELLERSLVRVDHAATADELWADLAETVDVVRARARDHHGHSPKVVGVGSAGP